MGIAENYRRLRAEVPAHVTIVLAAKTRTAAELEEAIRAGATDVGENYVQEAVRMRAALGALGQRVRWHLIGHLQRNKINKALPICDVIQTVDSLEQAAAIDQRVPATGKQVMPVLIEINIGNEDAKAGLRPEEHEPFEDFMEGLVTQMSRLAHLRVAGLMTMGPWVGDPEDVRPYFRRTRALFERLRGLGLPNVEMKYLSMGMTYSYKTAIEEGSNMIRVGTAVFGERPTHAG